MYYVQFKFGIAKTWNNWHDPLHLFCRPLNSSTKAEGWRESVNILFKSIIYRRDMKGNWCFSAQSMTSSREIKGIHGEQFPLLIGWPSFLPPWVVDCGDLSTCCLWALLYIAIMISMCPFPSPSVYSSILSVHPSLYPSPSITLCI